MAEQPDEFAGPMSARLMAQLEEIETMTPEQAWLFLDMLESGVPKKFRYLLDQASPAENLT